MAKIIELNAKKFAKQKVAKIIANIKEDIGEDNFISPIWFKGDFSNMSKADLDEICYLNQIKPNNYFYLV